MSDLGWMALPLGVGLAIGLNAVPGWGVLVLIAAIGFAIAEITLGSPRYQDYRAQLGGQPGRGSYVALATLWNCLKVGGAATVGVLIRAASN